MSAPLDLLAGVVAQETALGTTSPTMSGGRPRSKRMRLAEGDERRAGSPSSDEAAQERSDGDTSSGRPVEQSPADSKRALR